LDTEQIPLIDIARLPADRAARSALDQACRDWGFFQIVNHGVDPGELEETQAQMAAFFALPVAEKHAVIRTAENAWGFYDQELTKNIRDWKEIFDVGPPETQGPLAGSRPQWPASLPGFKAALLTYSESCERVAHTLLSAIGANLGAPANRLAKAFEPDHTSFLRLNYYPVCDDPAAADSLTVPEQGRLGIGHHTDAGALTVLKQNQVAGLQVEHDGKWHLIEPRADAFVINIGDIVQVWSNDRYRAPLHRVIANGANERYSAAFFFNPAHDTDYGPLSSVCDERHPPRYESINWGEFRAGRAAGDYADYGEEIQISQFRTGV